MPGSLDQVRMMEDLITLQEGWDFEAKEAQGRDGRGALPKSFWETYSAMANTDGGRIALGVREHPDRSLEVLGLDDPQRIETDLWNLLGNRQKVSKNVLQRRHVQHVGIEDQQVLIVEVPRALRSQRPVYLGSDPFTGTYVRTHEGDRVADRERVRRMLTDADPDRPVDSQVLEHYSFEDLHTETLKKYRQIMASRNPDHPFLAEDDLGFLRQVRAWGRDRERGVEGPTLAGLLMFGREGAICDRMPHFFLEYRREPINPSSNRRWDDRLIPDGTWNANLLQFYWQVYPRLVEGLQVPFAIEGGVRKGETPVHEALREALVNSLIHAVHGAVAGVRVVRRQDEYFFSNAGRMLVSPEQAIAGGESQCRSPSIQHEFVLVGLGERAGSGIPKILQAWKGQHWRQPLLAEDVEKDITKLTLSTVSLLPADVLEELTELFPEFPTLEEEARLAVATARIEGRVTNRRLQQMTDMHGRDLTVLLRSLVERHILAPHGDRGGSWYTVSVPDEVDSAPSALHSPQSPEDSPQSPEDSPQSPEDSPQSSMDFHQSRTTGAAVSSEPMDEDSDELVKRVSSGSWARHEEVEAAILEVCRLGFLSGRQIADRLNRKAKTIQHNYLPKLVEQGRLALKYPDERNHPDQGYRTSQPEDMAT